MKSVLWNALAPVNKPLARLGGQRIKRPTTAQDHAEQYQMLMESSRRMIGDECIGFVFTHLPVPHPGGFYDRQTGRLGLMVRFPGSESGVTIGAAFPELEMHGIVEEVIAGRIQSNANLQSWLLHHP